MPNDVEISSEAPGATGFVPKLFLWGFGIALLGSLDSNGGSDSRGLLLSWVGLLVAALGLARGGRFDRPRLDWLAVVAVLELGWLVLIQTISVLPTGGYFISMVLAALPLTYLLVRSLGPTDAAADRMFFIIRSIAIPVFILAIVEFLLLRTRPTAIFIDANVLAAFANAVFFPAFADWVAARDSAERSSAILPLSTALLACVTLAVTTSLGGFLSFAFALFLFLLGARTGAIWRPAAFVLVLFSVVSVLVYSVQDGRPSPLSRVAQEVTRTEGARPAEFSERIAMVRSALSIYADHTWYGTGPGTFKGMYPAYRSTADRSTLGNMAHNDYVQFLQEGGPPLLCALLAAGFSVLLALARLTRRPPADCPAERRIRIQELGIAAGALAVFVHAIVNFVFYVLPLALLIGTYLALLSRNRQGRELPVADVLRPRLAWFLCGIASFVLIATLGLRTAFSTLLEGDCQLNVCRQLSGDSLFMWKFANLMVATQPSWAYAGFYLAKRDVDAAVSVSTADQERAHYAAMAAGELGHIVITNPALSETFKRIGDLLRDFPSAASALPAGVPREPEALYLKTVRLNPLDFAAASAAAELMAQRGATAEAFQLLLDVRDFWYAVPVKEADRTNMLVVALPLALKLGACDDALLISSTLLSMKRESILAESVKSVLKKQQDSLPITPGCGVSMPASGPATQSSSH